MVELSATIKLRPARVALLVRPGDRASLVKFMRISACMWGGRYNPIIPVFRKPPKTWAQEFPNDVTGLQIAKGYIQFFEPDAFVEAQPGLLKDAGLELLGNNILDREVISLDALLAPEPHRSYAELQLGLSVSDCVRDIYETEQRFELRNPVAAISIASPPSSGLAEALFGVYPDAPNARYFAENYNDVFRPNALACSAESWRRVCFEGATTPLSITSHKIEPRRTWHDEPKIYVFDPTKPTDLIDLWNLRGQPSAVLPVPIGWFEDLLPDIHKVISAEYRPLQGNPNGVMQSARLEFSRGLAGEARQKVFEMLRSGLPASRNGQGSLTIQDWRDRIWDRPGGGMMNPPKRLTLEVDEKHVTLEITGEGQHRTSRFEALRPAFASRFGASDVRWVNSLRVSNFGMGDVATIYPRNTFDRSFPRLVFGSHQLLIGSEGWSIGERFSGLTETLRFETQQEAVLGFLKRSGVEAEPSEPGHIAKQMLEQLGGLWGVNLIADEETLRLMNDMAGAARRRQNSVDEVLEEFDPRSRRVTEWHGLLQKRAKNSFNNITVEDFTKANILTLGLETKCPHCMHKNWDAVDRLGYRLTCKRCLNEYPFPQGAKSDQRQWKYRVSGPFSVQDFARGAYGVLLALKRLDALNLHHNSINFVTALDLSISGQKVEVDYVAFHQADGLEDAYEPSLILGEAKSFGERDLIQAKEVERFKHVALKFPGAYLAISVLREEFLESEKVLLRKLVRWGRKLSPDGEPRNRVLLFTGRELLRPTDGLTHVWKDLGGAYEKFADYHHSRSLRAIADATVSIHLGLPSFDEERRAAWERRKKKRPNDFPHFPGQWGRILSSVSGPSEAQGNDD